MLKMDPSNSQRQKFHTTRPGLYRNTIPTLPGISWASYNQQSSVKNRSIFLVRHVLSRLLNHITLHRGGNSIQLSQVYIETLFKRSQGSHGHPATRN